MFKMMKVRKTMVAALALSAMIAGNGLAANQQDLVVAVTKNPTRLDPMAENSNVNGRFSFNILETLIGRDFKNNSAMVPSLATEWKRIDDQTLELKLREGVKCHNGEDFNAEDVAFSFGPKRFMGEGAPGAAVAKQYLGDISSVEAIDPYTVRITSSIPDPLLEQRFANIMGNCVCKDAFEAVNDWEAWNKAPVGTGPYKVTEFKPDEYIKLEAFDSYWGEKAPVKSVTFKVVPETAARVAGLLSGEFDIITEIMPDQFKTIESNPKTDVVGGPINNIRVIVYDKMADKTLADPRIRQAMNYAIDRKLLVETIYQNKTGVPNGLQMESFGNLYVEDFKGVSYNPEKAKKLLKEAGYKGQEISYRYLQDYYTGEVTTAQILVEMWRQVGLNVKLELKENWGQIESDGAREGRGIVNWSNTAVYPDPLSQLYRNYGPDGFFQSHDMWKNDDFNTWGEQLKAIDPAKRREAMEHMLQIYEHDDPPGTYLYYLPMFYGKQADVKWSNVGTDFMDLRAGNLSVK